MAKAERQKIIDRKNELTRAIEEKNINAAEKAIKFLIARAYQMSREENKELSKFNNVVIEMAKNKAKEGKETK